MASFNFRALNTETNHEESGVVEASDEAQASEALVARGLQVLGLTATSESHFSNISDFFSRVSVKDIVAFTREFAVMIGASVPIVEALKIIAQQTQKGKLRRVISTIGQEVDSGNSLSSALGAWPKLFSNFFVSVVRSGEQSGKLDEALNYISDEMEKDFDMNSKVRGAMIYPAFVIGMMGAIGILMMVFVVPKLTSIITEAGGVLPLPTRVLIAISDFLVGYWWVVVAAVVAAVAGFRLYLKSTFGRHQFDYLILRLPIFGKLLRMIYVVRFTRSMNTLIMGGVDISSSLKVAGEVVNNTYFQALINQTIIEVQGGNSIVTAFLRSKVVPAMVSQMIQVGEKTGKLDVVLERITAFYNREITTMLSSVMALIEPMLMVVMGVGVFVMVAAILLPMYNVVSQI